MTETTIGAASAAPALPKLDTPEARWAYALTVWRDQNLPTPGKIDVEDDLTVWLPSNERGHVDDWVKALSIERPPRIGSATRTDGTPNSSAVYSTSAYTGPLGQRHVLCYLDLTADAAAHGGPTSRPDDGLEAALDGVAAMLTPDEPTPVCNRQLGVEQYCARDAGHDADCDPNARRPQMSTFWKNEDGTVGQECVCGVTFDGFEPKDRELLDRLFAEHECNTLPPMCGFLGGCNYGPDMTPAAAEQDGHGLCGQHRAEVFPDGVPNGFTGLDRVGGA